MKEPLQIIPTGLLDAYLDQVPKSLPIVFDALEDAEISTDAFSFYTSVSSVYSGKIEGEEIELDSYVKHKKFGIAFLPDCTRKIDDLYDAHTFAKSNELNEKNISEAHRLLSRHLLPADRQGKYRSQNMYVITREGRIEYVAALPHEVENEMKRLFGDITVLLKTELKIEEVFCFASLVHLIVVKIHPWNDGNGRTARLLEKWFLAQKLGHKAWFVQSEKMYYEYHDMYYGNIRLLGMEYAELDYARALPFALMLPSALVRS